MRAKPSAPDVFETPTYFQTLGRTEGTPITELLNLSTSVAKKPKGEDNEWQWTLDELACLFEDGSSPMIKLNSSSKQKERRSCERNPRSRADSITSALELSIGPIGELNENELNELEANLEYDRIHKRVLETPRAANDIATPCAVGQPKKRMKRAREGSIEPRAPSPMECQINMMHPNPALRTDPVLQLQPPPFGAIKLNSDGIGKVKNAGGVDVKLEAAAMGPAIALSMAPSIPCPPPAFMSMMGPSFAAMMMQAPLKLPLRRANSGGANRAGPVPIQPATGVRIAPNGGHPTKGGSGKVVPPPMYMNPQMMKMMTQCMMTGGGMVGGGLVPMGGMVGGVPFFGVGGSRSAIPVKPQKRARGKDKPEYKCRRCGKVKAGHVCPFKDQGKSSVGVNHAGYTRGANGSGSHCVNKVQDLVFGRSVGTQTEATGVYGEAATETAPKAIASGGAQREHASSVSTESVSLGTLS
jgi:hypothetical protein